MTVSVSARRNEHRDIPSPELQPEPRAPSTSRPAPSTIVQTAASRALTAQIAKPSDAQIQRRLEAYRQEMSGPYVVDGREVKVPAGFRMNGGTGQNRPEKYVEKIRKILG